MKRIEETERKIIFKYRSCDINNSFLNIIQIKINKNKTKGININRGQTYVC